MAMKDKRKGQVWYTYLNQIKDVFKKGQIKSKKKKKRACTKEMKKVRQGHRKKSAASSNVHENKLD